MWIAYALVFLQCQGILYIKAEPDQWDSGEEDCPQQGDHFLPYVHVLWGVPDRAIQTTPPGIRISKSVIPKAGLGVISDNFINKYTWLGEYEGEVVVDKNEISTYAWQLFRNDARVYLVDAYDVCTSNWLRFVNCARRHSEENVLMYECKGKVYYQTFRDIYPGQELLVYYGQKYASDLGIDVDEYYNS